MKKAVWAIVSLALVASVSSVRASDRFEQELDMIQIGADDSMEVPVEPGSDETVQVTPVFIEKDETGRVVSVRTALSDKDIGYFIGVRYGRPLRVSVSAGLVFGKYNENSGAVHGTLVEADVGQGGAAISVGRGSAGEFSSSINLTVLHTFGRPWGTIPGDTYVGLHQKSTFFSINILFGMLYRVNNSEGTRWLTMFGAGVLVGDLWERNNDDDNNRRRSKR